MNDKLWTRWIVVCWCICTLAMPQRGQAADPAPVRSVIRDVALDGDGSLRGSLMNREGKPQANSDILLVKGNEIVTAAKTRDDGSFAIKLVRPGVYEIASANASSVYRVWNARSAPPAAQSTAMLVESNTIVRGQEWSPMRRALILSGVIITSGVIGGVIGYNIKEEDDAS